MFFPLLEGEAQVAIMFRVMSVEALRKDTFEYRHREERAGDFDKREPFCVVSFAGHRANQTSSSSSSASEGADGAISAGTFRIVAPLCCVQRGRISKSCGVLRIESVQSSSDWMKQTPCSRSRLLIL